MKLTITHELHPCVTDLLTHFFTRLESFMADVKASLDALTAKVNAEATVEQSAVTLLQGLSAQIAALKSGGTDATTAAAIDALAAQVGSQTQALADAVTANTPAE